MTKNGRKWKKLFMTVPKSPNLLKKECLYLQFKQILDF